MPLKIAVVGAGIAGLSAAVSLRRAGHVVVIYERSALSNEVGAAINVPPNASRPLLGWGLDPVSAEFVAVKEIAMYDPFMLQQVQNVPMGNLAQYNAPFYFAHRVDLHQALRKLATEEGAPGSPVTIYLNSEVAQYDTEAPSLTLTTGDMISPDLIVAADGVHSMAVETILGHPNPAQPPERFNYCFRFLMPVSVLKEDAELSFFAEGREGKMRIWTDNVNTKRLVCYPCRNNEVLNFIAMFHNEEKTGVMKEDWQAAANQAKMLDIYKDFHPKLLNLMSTATEVKSWPLLSRSPIPVWKKGKLVLAGDAAHPMLPNQGQGGAQCVEDAVALGITLCGAEREHIEERIAIYEKIRINRALAIQVLSKVGQEEAHLYHKEAAKYMGSEHAVPKTPRQLNENNFGYDVAQEAKKCMKEIDSTFELPKDYFQKSGPFSG